MRSRSPWRLPHNAADKITHCPHCAAPDLALFKDRVDPLHDEVMYFAALMEGGLAQRFVDRRTVAGSPSSDHATVCLLGHEWVFRTPHRHNVVWYSSFCI